ncbi:MAG TPA: OmpH family outer membrane protein [Bryobacteraceae bacterium]|nr:OmpH family outer membrane protein [Bryobacteraceae bacterium]
MNKLACIFLAAIACVGVAAAQTKVAVVNSQKAVLDTEEIKKAQIDLQNKYKPRQDAMDKLQKELQDIQNQLQSGKLNQLGEQELTAQGQKKQRELTRLQQDLQEDVDRDRNEILQKTGTRMQEAVKKLADEKGLDIVVDTSNTVFYKAALDLTAEATAAYNKAYPVK